MVFCKIALYMHLVESLTEVVLQVTMMVALILVAPQADVVGDV